MLTEHLSKEIKKITAKQAITRFYRDKANETYITAPKNRNSYLDKMKTNNWKEQYQLKILEQKVEAQKKEYEMFYNNINEKDVLRNEQKNQYRIEMIKNGVLEEHLIDEQESFEVFKTLTPFIYVLTMLVSIFGFVGWFASSKSPMIPSRNRRRKIIF